MMLPKPGVKSLLLNSLGPHQAAPSTLDRTDGLTKLIIDPKTQRVLGVGIVGVGAGEMIAEGVVAIEMGAVAKI